jgi:hypothetical protein
MQSTLFLGRSAFDERTQCYTFKDGSGEIPVETMCRARDAADFFEPRIPMEGNAAAVFQAIYGGQRGGGTAD